MYHVVHEARAVALGFIPLCNTLVFVILLVSMNFHQMYMRKARTPAQPTLLSLSLSLSLSRSLALSLSRPLSLALSPSLSRSLALALSRSLARSLALGTHLVPHRTHRSTNTSRQLGRRPFCTCHAGQNIASV
jgi:hypothetical protein